MSGGGTGSDGVDGLATKSANQDEVQIIVYDYYSTVKTTGSDSVTVNVSNLPAALAGKEIFVTQFVVDETHSNPYSVWVGQNKPKNPTEAQWQEMRKAQHLALAQPVSKKTVDTSFTTTFTLNKQGATLIILGLKRPLTGRNALVEIEGEDYDGQSGATKEDSSDTSLGQSISVTANGNVYFENVDYTDAGVASVQLRVKSQAAATVELHADSATGALLGRCTVPSTSNAWATQTCTLDQTAKGVARLYLVFSGAMHLNWLKFAAGTVSPTGTGGAGGGSGGAGGGAAGGMGGSATSGAGGNPAGAGGAAGSSNSGAGGNPAGAGGAAGGSNSGAAGSSNSGAGAGSNSGAAGSSNSGAAGSSNSGAAGSSNSGAGGAGASSGTGGTTPVTGGGKGAGCACELADARAPSAPPLVLALFAGLFALRRRRTRA
jgi:MYXO-CTERM domain-containing protein